MELLSTRRIRPSLRKKKPQRATSNLAQTNIILDPVDLAKASSAYSLQELEHFSSDLEHVRARPKMYVPGLNADGLHFVFEKLLDVTIRKGLDESTTFITVTANRDGSLTLEDDSQGLSVEYDAKLSELADRNVSVLEGVMTDLLFFRRHNNWAYELSGGLHLGGAGMAMANLLSAWCEVEVYRDGFTWQQSYQRGVPQGPVRQASGTIKHGTKITFQPDEQVFEVTDFDGDRLACHIKEVAANHRAITFGLNDQRRDPV